MVARALPRSGVVLDHEHPAHEVPARGQPPSRGGVRRRQGEAHGEAAAGGAGRSQRGTDGVAEAAGDRQAEAGAGPGPGAPAGVVEALEGPEHLVPAVLGNPGTPVDDVEPDRGPPVDVSTHGDPAPPVACLPPSARACWWALRTRLVRIRSRSVGSVRTRGRSSGTSMSVRLSSMVTKARLTTS